MNEVLFKNRKLNTGKLLSFGFEEADGGYAYAADIADGQLKMAVTVSKDGRCGTAVTDNSSGDEYVLHLVPGAAGAFVGRVKAEYEALLETIAATCFDVEVFKSEQAKAVIAYVRAAYGDELEYLWQKFPDNAVVRRKDNRKWYAALLTVSGRKLGFDSDEPMEILDLRMKPEELEARVDGKRYFPGYHMNKKHWVTLCLNQTVPDAEIFTRIDESYLLAVK